MSIKSTQIHHSITFKELATDPANPYVGEVYFNQTEKRLKVWDGVKWIVLGGASGTINASISNNQSTWAEITDYTTPANKSDTLLIRVTRETSTTKLDSAYTFAYVYMNATSQYGSSVSFVGDDAGMEFRINPTTDKLEYKSSNMAGANYSGTVSITAWGG